VLEFKEGWPERVVECDTGIDAGDGGGALILLEGVSVMFWERATDR
jgi:hypothetical protein